VTYNQAYYAGVGYNWINLGLAQFVAQCLQHRRKQETETSPYYFVQNQPPKLTRKLNPFPCIQETMPVVTCRLSSTASDEEVTL
jgi:hypothetical protein